MLLPTLTVAPLVGIAPSIRPKRLAGHQTLRRQTLNLNLRRLKIKERSKMQERKLKNVKLPAMGTKRPSITRNTHQSIITMPLLRLSSYKLQNTFQKRQLGSAMTKRSPQGVLEVRLHHQGDRHLEKKMISSPMAGAALSLCLA
jgi:hypothetical protein